MRSILLKSLLRVHYLVHFVHRTLHEPRLQNTFIVTAFAHSESLQSLLKLIAMFCIDALAVDWLSRQHEHYEGLQIKRQLKGDLV